MEVAKPSGSKSFVIPVSQNKLLSSRAERDAQSDQANDITEQKSDGPSFTQDLGISMTSYGDIKSALKNI